ncbi:MAG: hypothetical protein KDA32_06065 [Phycisphaerales bacterium]|nr:hypothetical protein [Phycisphaerales bacterium]
MERAPLIHAICKSRLSIAGILLVSLLGLTVHAGCSSGWGFERIALGDTPSQYERALPLDGVRRTQTGMCWTGPGGAQSDVVVVQTSKDGRVCAKFRVTESESPNLGEPRYAFRAALDPQLYGVARADPINALRALLLDIRDNAADPVVSAAQRRVAGAIARWLVVWPGVDSTGLDEAEQDTLLREAPSGGTATMRVTSKGAFQYEYTVEK